MPLPLSVGWLDTALLTGALAASSLAGYQQDLTAYLHFCADHEALTATTLARWRTYMAIQTPLSPHTINRRLSAVKRVLHEAAAQGYVDIATAEGFRRVPGVPMKALKSRVQVPTRLTPGQVRILCDVPDRTRLSGWRDRALLLVLASSGCRVSEIVSLTLTQIRSIPGSFFVEVLGKNQTIPRLAPLSHEAAGAIEAWLARRDIETQHVFTTMPRRSRRPTARPLDRVTAWRIVERYARQVGLQHVSPHSFRRFVGTALAKRDIRQAQRALGHQRIDTTARFYVFDELEPGLTDGLF